MGTLRCEIPNSKTHSEVSIWLQFAIDSKTRLVGNEELFLEEEHTTNRSLRNTSTALGPVGSQRDLYEVLRPDT